MMASLKYIEGDATKPVGSGMKIIPHICNTDGQWGSGFVVALTKRWAKSKLAMHYHTWHRITSYDKNADGIDINCLDMSDDDWENLAPVDFTLGNIQAIKVEDDIIVANMIAQKSTGGQVFDLTNQKNIVLYPLRFSSLYECMLHVAVLAEKHDASIHCPRFGAGLASGVRQGYNKDVWQDIEDAIQGVWVGNGIDVTVYDYKG